MTSFAAPVSQTTVASIERRAARLASLIEVVTQGSSERRIRETGAQLVERLGEWVEEIKELNDAGDGEAQEKARTFDLRLRLAEEKTLSWNLPPELREPAAPPSRSRPSRRPARPVPDAA